MGSILDGYLWHLSIIGLILLIIIIFTIKYLFCKRKIENFSVQRPSYLSDFKPIPPSITTMPSIKPNENQYYECDENFTPIDASPYERPRV